MDIIVKLSNCENTVPGWQLSMKYQAIKANPAYGPGGVIKPTLVGRIEKLSCRITVVFCFS